MTRYNGGIQPKKWAGDPPAVKSTPQKLKFRKELTDNARSWRGAMWDIFLAIPSAIVGAGAIDWCFVVRHIYWRWRGWMMSRAGQQWHGGKK